MSPEGKETARVRVGYGPAWGVDELPAPMPYNRANILKLIGPGVILLSLSIGSGEWLMGPAAVVKYGTAILWITTVGIVTQVLFNLECSRYTLYCGEPIMIGFTRLWPGPKFWTPAWIIISFLCLGPGWAVASATALAAMILNRMPGKADQPVVQVAGAILFLAVIVILMFGGKIEALLERINKYIVAFIFASLIILCIGFVPGKAWADIFTGFFRFGWLPAGKVDWFLLAGLAGYAGAGGIFNMAQSNWFRDKGYAMGATVGYIPSAIGGRQVRVSPVGKVFAPTRENFDKFRTWWRYAVFDQTWVWGLGCWIGMFLCTLLAYGMIPTGTSLSGWATAAHQAEGVAKVLGPFGWYWLLFIGFWVLWGTQLTVSDTFVRQVTDLLWYASPTVRKWTKEDIRKLYYGVLIAFTIWAFYMFNKGVPLFLVALVANFANVAFFVGGIQLLFMDRLLPREVRGHALYKLGVLVLVLFYGAFMVVGLGTQLFGLKF